jgi:hypothetical protein
MVPFCPSPSRIGRTSCGAACHCQMVGEGDTCHPRQARGLPAIAGRGDVGAPGSSRLLLIRPAPPNVTPFVMVTITARR